MKMTRNCTALAGVMSLVWAAFAAAADPVGVLTEIRAERGQVEVKRAGETQWTAAQPLLALRPGDQLRVTGEARAALVSGSARGGVVVPSSASAGAPMAARHSAAVTDA